MLDNVAHCGVEYVTDYRPHSSHVLCLNLLDPEKVNLISFTQNLRSVIQRKCSLSHSV